MIILQCPSHQRAFTDFSEPMIRVVASISTFVSLKFLSLVVQRSIILLKRRSHHRLCHRRIVSERILPLNV